MQISQSMEFHQRSDQTATGFGQTQSLEMQHRVGPRIQTYQIAGAGKMYPLTIAEFIPAVGNPIQQNVVHLTDVR